MLVCWLVQYCQRLLNSKRVWNQSHKQWMQQFLIKRSVQAVTTTAETSRRCLPKRFLLGIAPIASVSTRKLRACWKPRKHHWPKIIPALSSSVRATTTRLSSWSQKGQPVLAQNRRQRAAVANHLVLRSVQCPARWAMSMNRSALILRAMPKRSENVCWRKGKWLKSR